MTRGVITYAALLVGTLGVAWVEWTKEPDVVGEDEVVVVDGKLDDLETIHWKSGDEEVLVERRKDDRGVYAWVTYTKWVEVPPEPKEPENGLTPAEPTDEPAGPVAEGDAAAADDAAPPAEAEPAPEPEKKAEVQQFKAGKDGDTLLEAMAPLLGKRKLTDVDATKLEALGLSAPEDLLSITRRGKATTLELGERVYGTQNRYARLQGTNTLYLLGTDALRILSSARTRLPNKDLVSVEEVALTKATIQPAEGAAVDVVHKNKDDEKAERWVPAADPDTESAQVETWMDKLLTLRASTYVQPDAQPADLTPRFSVTLVPEAGASETIEVFSGADGKYYAKSEHTRGLVELLKSQTEPLVKDVTALGG